MKFIKKYWPKISFPLVAFIIWRLALFDIGTVAYFYLPFKASFPYINEQLISSGHSQAFWHWANFDGVHYLTIAQYGYGQLVGSEQVFFPLYPALIKLINFLTLNSLVSGLLISNLSILGAATLLFNMTKSKWSVLFLFCFPTSYYFGAVYTESLFLLLVLASVYFSKGKWLFSYLAGLTRLVGGFIGAGVVGVATYSLYLWYTFGNPFYFLSAQGSFANNRANSLTSLVFLPQVVYRYLKIFVTASPAHYDYWIAVLEFSALLFGLAFLIWATLRKKFPAPWLVFSWAALILPTFSGSLSAMPRFLLPIFPIYIYFGQIISKRTKIVLLLLFSVLLALLTTLFLRGYWVS